MLTFNLDKYDIQGALNNLKTSLDKVIDKPNDEYDFSKEFNADQFGKNINLSDSDSDDYDAKREAREYIRTFLQVENESTMIKEKVGNKRDWKYGLQSSKNEGLYDMSKWDKLEQRENQSENIDLHQPRSDDFDEDEDQKIAYELLNRYKKDKQFIKKDLKKLKFANKNMKEIIEGERPLTDNIKPPGTSYDDVVLRMELRHKERKEQKDKRKREIMEKKEEEKKLREIENRKLKANLDLEGVVIDPKPKTVQKRSNKAQKLKKEKGNLHVVPETPAEHQLGDVATQQIMSGTELGFEDRLTQLRQKRESCEKECQKYTEDVDKIKEMVRKEVEELKNLDRVKKFQEIEKVRKRELEEEKKRLEQERSNAEKEIRRFRTNKMFNTLNSLFTFESRRKKKQIFNKIRTHVTDNETKIKRNLYSINFRMKSMVYQAWRDFAQKQAQEKLFQQYKQEKIKERLNLERAAQYHKTETQRKYFNGIKTWLRMVQDEKRIEEEHERKLQLFLENMKRKEEEKKRKEALRVEIERKREQELRQLQEDQEQATQQDQNLIQTFEEHEPIDIQYKNFNAQKFENVLDDVEETKSLSNVEEESKEYQSSKMEEEKSLSLNISESRTYETPEKECSSNLTSHPESSVKK